MRLGLALYDPSFLAEDGSYWTWANPLIDRKTLEALYYNAIRKAVKENESSLREAELIGGYISIAEGQFYFRILDGGRDRQNRPGRFVVLFACIADEAHAVVPDLVWRSRIFEFVAAEAKRKCPVPPPPELSFEIDPVNADVNYALSRRLEVERQLLWRDNDDFSGFMQLCGNLPTGGWKATIQLGPQQRHAEVAAFDLPTRHSHAIGHSADQPSATRPAEFQTRMPLRGESKKAWRRWVLVATLIVAVVPLAILSQQWISKSTPITAIGESDNNEITILQITRIKRFERDGASPDIQKSMEIRFQVSTGLLRGDQLQNAEVEILGGDLKSLAYVPVSANSAPKHRITVIDRQTRMAKIDVPYQEWLQHPFILRLTIKSSSGDPKVFKSMACTAE